MEIGLVYCLSTVISVSKLGFEQWEDNGHTWQYKNFKTISHWKDMHS